MLQTVSLKFHGPRKIVRDFLGPGTVVKELKRDLAPLVKTQIPESLKWFLGAVSSSCGENGLQAGAK